MALSKDIIAGLFSTPGDYYGSETSVTLDSDAMTKLEFVDVSGSVTLLKDNIQFKVKPLQDI